MKRIYAAVCAGVVGYCLAYGAADYAKLPRPLYDPVHRTVTVARQAPAGTAVMMGYFGQLVWGLAGGLVAALLGALLGPRLLRRPDALVLWAGWALLALVGVGAFFTFANWP
ncbi:MAG TPA: hypothetical protein VGQ83_16055 [Polyangia bacterium]|jgi:hypothetical protein